MNAEPTDDPGEAGAAAPALGQRPAPRRAASRRAAATGPGESPSVPAAAPTTTLPTTPTPTTPKTEAAMPAMTTQAGMPAPTTPAAPGPVDLFPSPGETPTAELRGAALRGHPRPEVPPVPTNIYRSRRPGVAILLVIPAVAVGMLLIRAVAVAAFGATFNIAGIIASTCGLASLPFLVGGLYGLVTGAAHGAEHYGFRMWARPPLAYLIVGLAFVLAAGLAIR